MFGNHEELNKQISNYMIINIIGSNYLHENIISTCLDIVDGEYAGRFRVISLTNTDQLIYKKLEDKEKENDYGLLNLDWIKKTTQQRPATVILVYDVRNKAENVTWKEYENSIFLDISKIKKSD